MVLVTFWLFLTVSNYCFAENNQELTIDEFFNYAEYPTILISPTGEYLLFESVQPSWNTDSYQSTAYIYNIKKEQLNLLTNALSKTLPPRWSPSGEWLSYFVKNENLNSFNQNGSINNSSSAVKMYLYSTKHERTFSIDVGFVTPSFYQWSDQDTTIYFTTQLKEGNIRNRTYSSEWRDVIQYRHGEPVDQIHRLNIQMNGSILTSSVISIANLTFMISELVYVPQFHRLIFSSRSSTYEDLENFEIYSLDLDDAASTLIRLTNNEGIERELRLSSDGKHIIFRLWALSSGKFRVTQRRIFALDINNGQIERLAKDFNGLVTKFVVKPDGGVYFLGQMQLEVQVYGQTTIHDKIYRYSTWNGSYEHFSIGSMSPKGPIAFVFSSFNKPKEIYIAHSIDNLSKAKPITDFNKVFTQRLLPKSRGYRWINAVDQQQIEGVLHFPPGVNNTKNLPLLVLIHGGPYAASLNEFQANWYNWAILAASEGWLVLEPNYRGSTGYGDKFLDQVRDQPLSLPGNDILTGVDKLISDGLVDPTKLAVGGYSYGGFLTNWLITRTNRFNAALSGSGNVEHVSGWGNMDLPLLLAYLYGGFPWESAKIYQDQSPIYNLHRVRTPTLIVTGESDTRVPPGQSYILERGLHYLGIPTQLLVFPGEGHDLENNPWHGKIKVREELKWLKRFGFEHNTDEQDSVSIEATKLINRSNYCSTYLVSLFVFQLVVMFCFILS